MAKKYGFCAIFLSALANRLRVRMLQELSIKPMNVSELRSKLGVERTLISHNLAMLSKAELVICKRVGKSRIYSANEEVVPYIFFLMDKVVCPSCSIKRTCLRLKERKLPAIPSKLRPVCAGCR